MSLDGEEARRWLHLSDDSLRADLVGFTWTNDHCTVSIIEVKAVDAKGAEYAVQDGVVSGTAVDQMLSTRRLLDLVFSDNRDDELITTPARREILREHLYRELTKGTYSPIERKLWAERLQRLLDGSVRTDLRCHLIDVRLGVDSSSLRNMSVVAHEGEPAPSRWRSPNSTSGRSRCSSRRSHPNRSQTATRAGAGRRSRTHAPDRRATTSLGRGTRGTQGAVADLGR